MPENKESFEAWFAREYEKANGYVSSGDPMMWQAMQAEKSWARAAWDQVNKQQDADATDAGRYRKLRGCTAGEWDALNDTRLRSLKSFDGAVDALSAGAAVPRPAATTLLGLALECGGLQLLDGKNVAMDEGDLRRFLGAAREQESEGAQS